MGDYRDNIVLRILATPIKRYSFKRLYRSYLQSGEPEKLKHFKNCNSGKRCFIIGNGPSLRVDDLNRLKSEITMAANRIYNLFDQTDWRPTYYFTIDGRGIVDILPKIENSRMKNIFVSYEAMKYEEPYHQEWYHIIPRKKYVAFMYNDKSVHISEDITKYFSNGCTVLFTALQFAIYTGINEIYLLGVDFNYSHIIDKWGRTKRVDGVIDYFDGKEYDGARLAYDSVLYAWNEARKYCDEHGIRIYNATRGGKLEVFERIDLEKVLGEETHES